MSHPNGDLSPAEIHNQLKAWGRSNSNGLRGGALLGLADGGLVVAFAWGLSHAVTNLWDGAAAAGAIALPCLALVLSMALRAGLSFLAQRLNMQAARQVVRHVRSDFMSKALAGRIDARVQAVRLNALFEDSEGLEGYYTRFQQAALQARIIPLLVLVVIASQSWVCAGIIAVTLLPFVALMALLGMSSAAEAKRQFDALSRLSNLVLDRIRALPLILAFHDGARQTETVGQAATDVAERTLRLLRVAFITSGVLEFFSALSVALIAVYCGFSLLGELPFKSPESLSLSTAFFVLALSPEIYAPMRRLAAAYHDRQAAIAAACRLMAIQVDDAARPAERFVQAPELQFRDVVVTYADDPDFRIGPVCFRCAPGSVTCLAGPTGSGKTTLLRLILAPGQTDGITVDGKKLDADHDVSGQIAYVSQSPPILAGTLRDNLCLGNRLADDGQIDEAIERFGLQRLVEGREGGLETVLDERGSGLSGGERRRIGLARAWLKPALLVLLDEPTADLDGAAEAEVVALLPELFAGRTVVVTSHSVHVQALADQVVAL